MMRELCKRFWPPLLLGLAGLVVSAQPAAAAETIGLFIISSLAEVGIGVGALTAAQIGTAVVVAAAIGAQIAVNALFGPKPAQFGNYAPSSALPRTETGHLALRQSIPPRSVGYGRNRLAGSYVFYEVGGSNGVDSYDVLALHHGQIEAIVGYYLHDDVIALSGGIVQPMDDGRYQNNLISIQTRLGLPVETVYSSLVTALPTLWTNAHIGHGLASLLLKCAGTTIANYTTIYPRGKPEPSVVADCARLYDWRDQTQNQADPTTWRSSQNPVIQVIDQLTHADRGMGLDFNKVILPRIDDWALQADICDALFDKADGTTEPRYQSNGLFNLDTDPAEVIEAILATCDGWLAENGDGTFKLVVGKYVAPQVTIAAKHVRGIAPRFGVPDEQLVNEIVPSYTEPQADYKTVPSQPFRDDASIATLGKVRSQALPLPWVKSHSQSRRLAKRRLRRINAPISGTIRTTLYGLLALGERWINLHYPDIDGLGSYDAAGVAVPVVIEIISPPQVDIAAATVTSQFVVVDADGVDAWDPASEEGARPALPEKATTLPLPTPANLGGFTAVFAGNEEDGFETYGLVVTFDDPVRPELTYGLAYHFPSQAFIDVPAQVGVSLGGGRWAVASGSRFSFADLGTTFTVRVRAVSPSGNLGNFSSTTTIVLTAP